MARDVKVAVVGAGAAAQVVHLPILGRLPEVEVVGIVDPQLAKARTVADRFRIPRIAGTLAELGDETEIEAVLVCSPTGQHEAVVVEALEAGAHVLCERPLTVSSSSAQRVLAAAEKADRELMESMHDNRVKRRGQRDEDAVEIWRTNRDLAQSQGVNRQRVKGSEQDAGRGDNQQDVVQQQSGFA